MPIVVPLAAAAVATFALKRWFALELREVIPAVVVVLAAVVVARFALKRWFVGLPSEVSSAVVVLSAICAVLAIGVLKRRSTKRHLRRTGHSGN